jgi:hypothetical protein
MPDNILEAENASEARTRTELERLENIEKLKEEIPSGKVLVTSVYYPDQYNEGRPDFFLIYVRNDGTCARRYIPDTIKDAVHLKGELDHRPLIDFADADLNGMSFEPVNLPLSRGFLPDRIIDTKNGRHRNMGMGWGATDIVWLDAQPAK